MSQRWMTLASIAVLCLVGCGQADDEPEPLPRNLLLISIDTLRADHLGCYGYERPTSPRLDAYARTGVVFRNCTSSSSWTAPAHLTIFTGLEPETHGCIEYPDPGRLNDNYETMAHIFTRAGFRTAALTGGGHAGRRHGLDIGFEKFETYGTRFENNLSAAKAWLGMDDDRPFFLFLHGFNVHKPYAPPPPYDRRFVGDYAGDYDIRRFEPEQPRPAPADLEYVISQYDGEMAYVDDLLGDLLDWLKERGTLRDTLVIITSDHGDEFYEHARCDHVHTLYDELVRVPWIMFGPRTEPAVVRDHVGTIDVLPTVLDLFELTARGLLQGLSRAELPSPEDPPSDADVFGFTGFGDYPVHLSSLRTSRWKLVVNELAGMKDVEWRVRRPRYTFKFKNRAEDFVELFDLQVDPGEQHNVAADNPRVVRELARRLNERVTECRANRLEQADPGAPDEEYLKALRALGYLE